MGTAVSEAAHKVRVLLDDPSAFDVSELAGLEATGAEPEAGFVPMVDGLAITDPLQPYAGSMPAELLEWFVSLGAEGATELTGLSAGEGGCDAQLELLFCALRDLIALEATVAHEGGGTPPLPELNWPWYPTPACPTVVVTYPLTSWTSVGPPGGVAGRCLYTRTVQVVTHICCVGVPCETTMTTAVETGSCPVPPNGVCPVNPPPPGTPGGCRPIPDSWNQ